MIVIVDQINFSWWRVKRDERNEIKVFILFHHHCWWWWELSFWSCVTINWWSNMSFWAFSFFHLFQIILCLHSLTHIFSFGCQVNLLIEWIVHQEIVFDSLSHYFYLTHLFWTQNHHHHHHRETFFLRSKHFLSKHKDKER